MPRVIAVDVLDVRFPTSRTFDGSDAMHGDGDYSAAYVVLKTDESALEGHGLTFTLGRGNELCVAVARTMAHSLIGTEIDELADGGRLVGDNNPSGERAGRVPTLRAGKQLCAPSAVGRDERRWMLAAVTSSAPLVTRPLVREDELFRGPALRRPGPGERSASRWRLLLPPGESTTNQAFGRPL